MASKDLIEPIDLVLEGPVPNVTHQLGKAGHATAKPRLLRFPANLVFAVAIARAKMGKPQKRERLRSLPLHAGLPLRKTTKLDQFGLARLQLKRELLQSLG